MYTYMYSYIPICQAQIDRGNHSWWRTISGSAESVEAHVHSILMQGCPRLLLIPALARRENVLRMRCQCAGAKKWS